MDDSGFRGSHVAVNIYLVHGKGIGLRGMPIPLLTFIMNVSDANRSRRQKWDEF